MVRVIPLDGHDAEIPARIAQLTQKVKDLGNNNIFTDTNITIDPTGHLAVNGLQLSAAEFATNFGNSSGSLGVSTTYTTIASATITVPAGYTKAIVFANAYAQAQCSINGDYLYVQCAVALSGGGGDAQSTGGIPAQSSSGTLYGFNQYPQGNATLSASYSGLVGGSTITASCQIQSVTGAWTASATTGGSVQVQVIFLA